MNSDYYSKSLNGDYPYPCNFPTFLAYIGILEIKRWKKTKVKRKIVLNYFLDKLSNKYPNLKKSCLYIKIKIMTLYHFAWCGMTQEAIEF